jgi:hypothetical protein
MVRKQKAVNRGLRYDLQLNKRIEAANKNSRRCSRSRYDGLIGRFLEEAAVFVVDRCCWGNDERGRHHEVEQLHGIRPGLTLNCMDCSVLMRCGRT